MDNPVKPEEEHETTENRGGGTAPKTTTTINFSRGCGCHHERCKEGTGKRKGGKKENWDPVI